jgi:predicted RNase H-like HicB family nuclease
MIHLPAPTREGIRAVELSAKIQRDDDGTYWAEVQELPGCFASGASVPELLEALREAVSLYLAEPDSDPLPVPEFESVLMHV